MFPSLCDLGSLVTKHYRLSKADVYLGMAHVILAEQLEDVPTNSHSGSQ